VDAAAVSDAYIPPEWAMVTIAFIDIRGFTGFADRATAREAATYLTEFFSIAVPVLWEHGGQVTKLLGDGLMTVFGAPIAGPDHADRAIAAASDLLAAVDRSLGDRCRIGIGINSGLVLVGTMGADPVVELGVVGDPVNVASRVQDATDELGEPLLVTEATRLMLETPRSDLVSRGSIALRGKAAPITVCGLRADPVTLSGRLAHRTQLT
jgi:adenylate cyclase